MLLSGGIDSATCLYLAKKREYGLRALTIAFHGIARGELEAAGRVATAAGVEEQRIVAMPDLREAGDVPGLKLPSAKLPPSYIPQRNVIFYGIAASYAEEIRADYIVGGHNKDDRSVFDDTRDGFFRDLQKVIWAGSKVLRDRKTTILRPLRTMTKPQVIRFADSLAVPLELTWSCHRDGKTHCWSCEGCRARVRSFAKAGVADPLLRAPATRRRDRALMSFSTVSS